MIQANTHNAGRQTRETSNQFRYSKPLDKYDQMDLEYNKRFKVDEKMLLSELLKISTHRFWRSAFDAPSEFSRLLFRFFIAFEKFYEIKILHCRFYRIKKFII